MDNFDDMIIGQIKEYCSLLQMWNSSYEEYAKSVGLSFTSLSILSAIFSNEKCTQKKLCEICFLPKQTVNAVITSFIKKEWIKMEEDPEDRRSKIIILTDRGKTVGDGIIKNVRESERNAMLNLSKEERDALINSTKRYVSLCRESLLK